MEILEHSVWPVADDDTVNEQSFFTLWGKTVVGLGEKFGKSFTIWEESKERMERAGFVDVVETRYKWPMNGWPSPEYRTHGNDGDKNWRRLRELGVWNQLRLYDGVEGFMIRLLTVVGGVRPSRSSLSRIPNLWIFVSAYIPEQSISHIPFQYTRSNQLLPPPFLTHHQWSYESAQVFLAQMRAALKDLKVHAYLDVTVVYGRKPGGKPRPSTATSAHSSSSGYPVVPLAPSSGLPEGYQGITDKRNDGAASEKRS